MDMQPAITVRAETPEDRAAVHEVNRLAFAGDDEARLAEALHDGGYARVSLVAEVEGCVVGHILFSNLPIVTDCGLVPALALAPMAVRPEYQKRGIGSALIESGLALCREQGHRIVVVLGHPHFYPRFGFAAKLAEPLASPFRGRDSWMALELVPGALAGVRGWVRYAPPFGVGPCLRLLSVAGPFAICKLAAGSPIPPWALAGDLFSITRTADELSVVCRQEVVPDGVTGERDWRGLRVAGAMPFTVVGVLAALTAPVANAGVGVFAVSTFDTDYLFVKADDLVKAIAALRAAGHEVD